MTEPNPVDSDVAVEETVPAKPAPKPAFAYRSMDCPLHGYNVSGRFDRNNVEAGITCVACFHGVDL